MSFIAGKKGDSDIREFAQKALAYAKKLKELTHKTKAQM